MRTTPCSLPRLLKYTFTLISLLLNMSGHHYCFTYFCGSLDRDGPWFLLLFFIRESGLGNFTSRQTLSRSLIEVLRVVMEWK